MKAVCHTICAFICISALPHIVFADDIKPKYYIHSPAQRLREKPHGKQISALEQGAPVEIIEEKDDWAKISITGWIRSAAIASVTKKAQKKPTTKSSANARQESPIIITSFALKHLPRKETGKSSRIVLTLSVKNVTSSAVRSWDGILIAQDQNHNFLFRTRVTQETANLKPGNANEIKYFWTYEQDTYHHLVSRNKNTLVLFLHNVQVK